MQIFAKFSCIFASKQIKLKKCQKHLQQHVKNMQESNYKELNRIIIGKGVAFIKSRQESAENGAADVGVITIIGKKENTMAARAQLEESLKSLNEKGGTRTSIGYLCRRVCQDNQVWHITYYEYKLALF